jgi:hypothetical protein
MFKEIPAKQMRKEKLIRQNVESSSPPPSLIINLESGLSGLIMTT